MRRAAYASGTLALSQSDRRILGRSGLGPRFVIFAPLFSGYFCGAVERNRTGVRLVPARHIIAASAIVSMLITAGCLVSPAALAAHRHVQAKPESKAASANCQDEAGLAMLA